MLLAVVLLLGDGCAHERLVLVENGFRETCRTAAEVDGTQVIIDDGNGRLLRCEVAHALVVAARELGAVLAHEEQVLDLGNLVDDLFDAPDELRAENQHLGIGKIEAIANLFRRVAIVQRHRNGARFQHAHVDRKPLKAVHHQDGDLRFALHSGIEEHVCKTVRMLVKRTPCDVTAIALRRRSLNELVLAPRLAALLADSRVHLDECNIVGKLRGVHNQIIGNGHCSFSYSQRTIEENLSRYKIPHHDDGRGTDLHDQVMPTEQLDASPHACVVYDKSDNRQNDEDDEFTPTAHIFLVRENVAHGRKVVENNRHCEADCGTDQVVDVQDLCAERKQPVIDEEGTKLHELCNQILHSSLSTRCIIANKNAMKTMMKPNIYCMQFNFMQ